MVIGCFSYFYFKVYSIDISENSPFKTTFINDNRQLKGIYVSLKSINVTKIQLDIKFQKFLGNVKSDKSEDGIPESGISVIDFERKIVEDGELTSWEIYSGKKIKVRLRIWRGKKDDWVSIGESELLDAVPGLNHLYLKKSIDVRVGDYLGFFVLGTEPSRSLPHESIRGKGYVCGDVEKMSKYGIYKDIYGGYAVKVCYKEKTMPCITIDSSGMSPGSIFIPFPNGIDLKNSKVSLNVIPLGKGNVELRPMSRSLLVFRHSLYIMPAYLKDSTVSKIKTGSRMNLFGCIVNGVTIVLALIFSFLILAGRYEFLGKYEYVFMGCLVSLIGILFSFSLFLPVTGYLSVVAFGLIGFNYSIKL